MIAFEPVEVVHIHIPVDIHIELQMYIQLLALLLLGTMLPVTMLQQMMLLVMLGQHQ